MSDSTEIAIKKLRSNIFQLFENVLTALKKRDTENKRVADEAVKSIRQITATAQKEIAGLKGSIKNGKPGRPGKDANEARILKALLKKIPEGVSEQKLLVLIRKELSKNNSLTIPQVMSMIRAHGSKQGGGGDIMHYSDLSALCNGSNKVFTIPAARKVIKVECTDAPAGIYKPITDFAVTGLRSSAPVVTLTDQVAAPLTGAVFIVYYVT